MMSVVCNNRTSVPYGNPDFATVLQIPYRRFPRRQVLLSERVRFYVVRYSYEYATPFTRNLAPCTVHRGGGWLAQFEFLRAMSSFFFFFSGSFQLDSSRQQ